jgi:hypothetical protein
MTPLEVHMILITVFLSVCVCVCVRERERGQLSCSCCCVKLQEELNECLEKFLPWNMVGAEKRP